MCTDPSIAGGENPKKKYSMRNSITLKLILTLVLAFSSLVASAQFINKTPQQHKTVEQQLRESGLVNSQRDQLQRLLDIAYSFRGTPYRYGQSSPKGFDCSGFTSYVFQKLGISLDRTSRGQINDGRRVDRGELRPGDLVFFSGRGGGSSIGHVGIVTQVEQDGGSFNFIHAAVSKGITVSNSKEAYYQSRYRGACRVLE